MPQPERAIAVEGPVAAVPLPASAPRLSAPGLSAPGLSAPAPRLSAPARTLPLLALAAGLAALLPAALAPSPEARLVLLKLGSILLAAAAFAAAAVLLGRLRARAALAAAAAFVEQDMAACYITDALGQVLAANRAVRLKEGHPPEATLAAHLAAHLASPGPILARLGAAALRSGSAVEDVVSRRGHLRLGAHRLSPDALLWRVEDLGDRSGAGRAADALSLPMLTAGPAGTILFMNEAFRKLVGGRPRHLDRVFRDPPPVSGRVHRLEGAEGPVDCLVAQVTGPGGRREIYLVPADPAPAAPAPWDAVEELPVAVLKVSRTGEVLASNRCARALLPAPIGAGTRLSDLVEGLGRPIIDWVGDVAAGRPTAGPQILHAVGSDRENFLRVSLTLAGPPDGLHLIAVLDDVTEHKSLEAQFVQAQKMQAIGQLAGGVAHDFNNLLTAIAGHCELLLLRRGPDDPDHADLVQINHNANRAAAVVNQLLAFSRKQSLVPEVFDLRDTLSELTHLLNRLVGDRVQLVLDHGPGLDCIRADRRKLEQVIVNLVVNARDAMPAGGEICIATRNLSLPEPIRRDRATVPAGDYVEVRVADQGTGIAPDLLPKIFEPFFTTKRPGEGTGLGLSTAYGIVKQTGGFIFVDSELGRGAVFTLLLPSHGQTTPQAAAAALPAAAPASHRAEGIILLVEDEAPVRAFASRALRLRGYTVLEADSAEAALDILADPAVRVDLFVSDVMMPGMDGPSWVREALADRPGTRVIFVSGYAEEAFAEHRALIPNSSFLPKPFSLAELTAAVDAKCA